MEQERLRGLLDQARQRLSANHGNRPGREIARVLSEDFDRLIVTHCDSLIREREEFAGVPERMALVATGGYGRRELNLYSDIDVLFLFQEEPGSLEEDFIKAFIYPFWSLNVDLSYLIKTTKQVLEEIGEDLDLTTALIGAHAIWGEKRIFDTMEAKQRSAVRVKYSRWLMNELMEAARERHAKYSDTLLLLEPNVKEAPGGLRDIQMALWVAYLHFGEASLSALTQQGLLTTREERALRKAHSFLIEIRNALHLLTGRNNDVLNFERQITVAPQLGFLGKDHALPEEQFMRSYYEHVGTVDRLVKRLLHRLGGTAGPSRGAAAKRLRSHRLEGEFWTREDQIWVQPEEVSSVARDPSWMMRFFTAVAQYGLTPDDFTLNLVEGRLKEIGEDFRRSPLNRDRFLIILKNPNHSALALRHMHRSLLLDAYIPEFALVRNLPRIDYYHQFTVDEHLLRSVACANDFFDEKKRFNRTHVARVAREVLRWDLLVFALLFHDVGKGEGRGHVIRGARMIQRIAQRLRLSQKESTIVHDLVLNHQKLSHMALRRNPDDPSVAKELARDLGDPELLRMLYVMTCCDLRAVSVDSWNDWRASLLSKLYERTMDVLMGRADKLGRNAPSNQALVNRILKVLEIDTAESSAEEEEEEQTPGKSGEGDGLVPTREMVEDYLTDFPDRYRSFTPPQQIALHVRLAQELSEVNRVSWQVESAEGSNYAVLHSVGLDTPGLFCNLCGALASRGLNILSAQVYTARSGVCVDIFQIQDAERKPPKNHQAIERLRLKLNDVLRGERDPKWGDSLPRRPQPISAARLDLRPPTVTVSNEDSVEGYSVLEIKAPDRPGLLYDITSLLDRHHVNIHLALIATESYQIVDVFYVTDWDNNRLEPGAKTERLRRELLETVSPDSAIGLEAVEKKA